MKHLLLFFLFASVHHSYAQNLSPDEKRIAELVQKQMPATLKLLEEQVNINSGTLNIAGVRKAGEQLRSEFEKIGFTTEWITLPDSLKRAGHLVAVKKGTKGKKLLLIGHLDTVFEPDMPPNPYKVLNDSTATGQGVNDMKGGNMVILAALQVLNQLSLLSNVSVVAYFTGDEEKSGTPSSVSRADFITRAKQADIALAFEGAQGLNNVASGRRGGGSWQLNVYGKQAHSAGMFNNNFGAIYEASRILNTWREQLSTEKYLTFSPGLIVGGTEVNFDSANLRADVSGKTNIIAPYAIARGDLRFLYEKQKHAARTKMLQLATTNNLAGTRAEVTFSDGLPAMEPTEGNNKLVQMVSKVTTDMGIGETLAGDPGSRGGGDISYIAEYLDCLDGLGASGKGAHAPGETINLKELPVLIQRAAILIYRLTR